MNVSLALIQPLLTTRSGGIVWNATMEERLRVLIAQKNSGGECAAAMNTEFGLNLSRNAIIGKSHRMGLKLKSVPVKPYTHRPRPQPFILSFALPKKSRPPTVLPPPVADADIPAAQLRTILTIDKGQCRFYVDREGHDQLFCGAPILEDRPYCPAHHARSIWVRVR